MTYAKRKAARPAAAMTKAELWMLEAAPVIGGLVVVGAVTLWGATVVPTEPEEEVAGVTAGVSVTMNDETMTVGTHVEMVMVEYSTAGEEATGEETTPPALVVGMRVVGATVVGGYAAVEALVYTDGMALGVVDAVVIGVAIGIDDSTELVEEDLYGQSVTDSAQE